MLHSWAAKFLAACLLLPLSAVAEQDARAGAHLEASGDLHDSVALVQQAVRAHGAKQGAASRPPAVASPSANASKQSPLLLPPQLYCKVFSHLCEPPFDCQSVTQEERDEWSKKGTAFEGKPNVRSWCFSPEFMPLMARCAAGDIHGAGKLQYELTVRGVYGPTTMEMDGSYCFIEGHCVNEAVTNDTTLEDAAKMCDERFGHEAWTTAGREDSLPEDVPGFGLDDIADRRNGFTNSSQTRGFLLAACAMGNFHCDVMYCRENYCKNPYYVNKYSHFLKEYGWVK